MIQTIKNYVSRQSQKQFNYILQDELNVHWVFAEPERWRYIDIKQNAQILQRINQDKFGRWRKSNEWITIRSRRVPEFEMRGTIIRDVR